jgi:DnaK suppressor protein
VESSDISEQRAAIEDERRKTADLIDGLQRSYADIVAAAELTSTDDEHDPEGATIAYERAQVWALLRQARADLVSLDAALVRIEDGTTAVCAVCGGPIPIERLLALPQTQTCVSCATW